MIFANTKKKTIRSKGDNDFPLCFCNRNEVINFDAFLFHTHMKWWYHLRSICDLYRAHDARVWFSEAIRHCYCHLHPLFMDSCAQIFPVFLKKRIRKYMAIVGLFLSNTDFFLISFVARRLLWKPPAKKISTISNIAIIHKPFREIHRAQGGKQRTELIICNLWHLCPNLMKILNQLDSTETSWIT